MPKDKQQTRSHVTIDKDGEVHVYFKHTGRYNEVLKPVEPKKPLKKKRKK